MDSLDRRLLLLTPSVDLGGGIERVVTAVARVWSGPVERVDLQRDPRDVDNGPLRKAGFTLRSLRTARAFKPDLILCMHLGLLPIAHVASRATGAETALMGYGTEIWVPFPAWERALIRKTGRLLTISSFSAHWLSRRSQVDERQIAVIPLPLEPRLVASASDAPLPPAREPLLVTVSRIVSEHRYKGHFEIAASLPRVLAERPDARWVVVGSGDDVDALRAECERLGVLHAVDFEQSVSDERLAELYSRATALVLPSVADAESVPATGEGFGLVYAEAGAFGTPAIASTAGGGATDIVTDGVTGLTTAPGDQRGLAHAMLSLLEDSALRERLGGALREHVLARYTDTHFRTSLGSALS